MHSKIAIVGNGFAGMGAGIRLKQAGFHDFTIFDRAEDVGGTWRDNSYPGCACDVESVLYSFSFEQNPSWSRSFSPQPEIWKYMQGVARKYDLASHMKYGHELLGARWDDRAKRWLLETSKGRYTAEVLVSGMGGLCEPAYPKLKGLESFQGRTFHSARWDHDYDLRGKRVGVIGTGASAIQFVPAIQPKVGKLSLFQRTPSWIIPRMDREITPLEHAVFEKLPAVQSLVRSIVWARRELFVVGFRNPSVMRAVELLAKLNLRKQVPDAKLRAKLTPDFRIGCKRILISNDYLPSLTQPNVDVITHGIREVLPDGVITSDGVKHELDVIIFGTGFQVTDMPMAHLVRGRDGRTLAEAWQGSPKAHLGTTVHGAPNFFTLLGPNTALGHSSVVLQIESQLNLFIEAMKHLRKKGLSTLEPRAEVQQRFVNQMDRETQGTVWTAGGCKSWYLDETGRNSTLWPSFTWSFRLQAHFKPRDYVFETVEQPALTPTYGTVIEA